MKLQIEILNFEENCLHRTVLADKRKNKDSKAVAGHPTVVLVSGRGVLTKNYAQDKTIIQRVSSNESLYYNCDEERKEISFVRREQVDGEIGEFSKVLSVKICSRVDDLVIRQTVSEFYKKTFTVPNLLGYKEDGKIILAHLIKKIEIPLLISVFIILLANYFVNSHLSEMNNKLQMELMNSRRNVDDTDSRLKEIQRQKADNTPNRPLDATVLVDRLAAEIPDGVTVTYFAVDPMKRKVETQKPLNIATRTIIIRGETLSANEITVLANNIGTLDFPKNVKIKNIEQKQDSQMLEFEVEVTY